MKLTFISKHSNSEQNLAVHPAPLNTPSCVIGFERKQSLPVTRDRRHIFSPSLRDSQIYLLEDFVLESRGYWWQLEVGAKAFVVAL